MIRDLEAIRYILLEVEKTDEYYIEMEELVCDAYSPKVISHHINLLIDSGYIEADGSGVIGGECEFFMIKRITSAGYDYLDNVRNNQVWEATKKQLASLGSSASLDIVKSISSKIILGSVGI